MHQLRKQRHQLNQLQNQNNDDIVLFAKAQKVYPRNVDGFFRRLKWWLIAVTLGIYYLAPFIRWDRGPHIPDQAILIDLPARRAYFFAIEIWPQEVYYLVGILVTAAILLFFATSLLGRVWCGYFCFQTVWTDLFIWAERFFQGERGARQRLHDGPWTTEKFLKISATHVTWIFIAFMTAGTFVLYFNDAPVLLDDFLNQRVSPMVLGFMTALTFSTYLMAGFAREQVCTYMCPYARFQSAMFDPDTLVIGYDLVRGEPRGKHKKGEAFSDKGHCIDCQACVQVCPMGIDIRDGLQIQCIACGLCIDACDDIMDKMSLPRGLVRYDTERGLTESDKGHTKPRFIRPRTIYYAIVLTAILALLTYGLLTRKPAELHVIHDRNPLFVQLSNGLINNGYDIKILNKTHDVRNFALDIEGIDNASIEVEGAGNVSANALPVAPDEVGHFHFFVKAATQDVPSRDIVFTITDKVSGITYKHDSVFMSGGTQ